MGWVGTNGFYKSFPIERLMNFNYNLGLLLSLFLPFFVEAEEGYACEKEDFVSTIYIVNIVILFHYLNLINYAKIEFRTK